MKVIAHAGKEEVAMVYIVELSKGRLVECVEALQPPLTRQEKWVLLISTLFGCPVGCLMCDAGGSYHGKLSADEILAQIEFLVQKRFHGQKVTSRQFKIQFARMGEPALNPAVLEVLEQLPQRYDAPGLIPSLSTIAPAGQETFFDRLLEIKQTRYRNGAFQFQFSIHTTDVAQRDRLIPVKKWSFAQMAAFGERFFQPGDRKVTLNFALTDGLAVDEKILLQYFSPEIFLIKITPLNPTYRANAHKLSSAFDPVQTHGLQPLIERLEKIGYQVLISIGELEENRIGSNCGQYLRQYLTTQKSLPDGYTYPVQYTT
ncbi:MAG: radical SAM protein [Anaerolineales bacterium]